MIYIIIMYTTKLSLAPANRLLSVYFFRIGASKGGGLVVYWWWGVKGYE